MAKFTVTGPTCSTGAGPDSASRRLMTSLFAHTIGETPFHVDGVDVELVCTAQVYAPPSRNAPTGTVHAAALCHPEVTTVPS
ncbi:MAG: hypothetical protein ACOH10_14280, partial [Rhodoglobus sp.]